MMRFDRFTERAQEVAQRAAEIIQRYGHNQIDTEQGEDKAGGGLC